MVNVKLKNNIGNPNTYTDIDTIRVPNAEGSTTDFYAVHDTRNITTTQEVDVSAYARAKVSDPNLKAENIAAGVSVLGLVGSFSGGASDYPDLTHKPSINGVELMPGQTGDDLGLADISVTRNLAQEVSDRQAADLNLQNQINARYTKTETDAKVRELALAKNNTAAFIPVGDYQPATKKYVDDNTANLSKETVERALEHSVDADVPYRAKFTDTVTRVWYDVDNKKFVEAVNDVNNDIVNIDTIKTALNISGGMRFKGTLGTGGTITSLPIAESSIVGHIYKVITAGVYAEQIAKVGDEFICNENDDHTFSWLLNPSGETPSGTVISVTAGNGLIGGEITQSGTIAIDTTKVAQVDESGAEIQLTIDSSYRLWADLKDKNGNIISTSRLINLPLETMVTGATYDNVRKVLILTLKSGDTIEVPIGEIVDGLATDADLEDLDVRLSADIAQLQDESMQIDDYDSDGIVAAYGGIVNYVEGHGGKIDHIKVLGVEQEIINKTVDINLNVPIARTLSLNNYAGYIVGTGHETEFTVAHSLNTKDVIVQVYDADTFEDVIVEINRPSIASIVIKFKEAPIASKQYKVLITKCADFDYMDILDGNNVTF